MASKRVQITIFLAAVFVIGSSSSEENSNPKPDEAPIARVQYVYAYDIQDPRSGVFTSKKESRDGNLVFGNYVIEDPDGTRRTVYYTSDAVRGFNAEVQRQEAPAKEEDEPEPPMLIQIPIHVPLALPLLHTYGVPPPPEASTPPTPPPPPPAPVMQALQIGQPLAIALAPAILTKTDDAPSKSEQEPPKYSISLTSPTHGYSY